MVDQNPSLAEPAPVNAFVATRGRGSGRSRGTGRGTSSFNRGSVPNQGGCNPRNNTNQRNQQPNGERSSCSDKRIICQICGKPGHHALDCYERMNTAYEGRIHAQRLTAMSSSPITVNKLSNGTWLLDNGANAHVTPELQNLVNPKEYNGNETIRSVGNDSGITISHFGSNQLHTKACSFDLNNVLHCPTASQNIIYAHRFTLDNHCYLLIFPYFFLVKDLKTRKTFFRGRCENGLYPFPSGSGRFNSSISALVGVRCSVQKWHARLGHPANSIIKFLISNKMVPIHGTSNVSFCESCPLGKSTRLL